MKAYVGPNVVCFSRAAFPPIPQLVTTHEDERETEGGGSRGTCKGASRKSLLNLSKVLSAVEWTEMGQCCHVTLSYWETWPDSKAALAIEKALLTATLGRLGCGFWRLEYQTKRFEKYGVWVPHWHVLLWIEGREVEDVEQWVRHWWAGSKRWSNESAHGVKFSRGDQARAAWYLAMHAAKNTQAPPFLVGRWWGFVGRDRILEAATLAHEGEISLREHVWFARLYRRATGLRVRQTGQDPNGFTWFLPRVSYVAARHWVREHVASEVDSRAYPRGRNPF